MLPYLKTVEGLKLAARLNVLFEQHWMKKWVCPRRRLETENTGH